MKKPDDVGRQGFYEAVQRTFSKLYPEGHDLHQGPEFGHVARELHHGSAVVTSQKAHLHGGFQFAAEHRWKRVAHYLRTKEKTVHRQNVAPLCPFLRPTLFSSSLAPLPLL